MRAHAVAFSVLVFAIGAGCSKSTTSTDAGPTAAPGVPVTASPIPGAAASGGTLPEAATSPATAGSPAASAPQASPTAVALAATQSPATAAPTATPKNSLRPVHLADIAGIVAQQEIIDLAQLGVIEPASGSFRPHDPLTRATFVRWLVKANNVILSDPAGHVRLAETANDPIFADVPPSSADYKYIQGLADAGYVIGIDAKHFAPQRELTREELMAIYIPLNRGSAIGSQSADLSPLGLTDSAQISKPYRDAFIYDHWNGGAIGRIFGNVKTFHPQRPATREEAVLAISHIGIYTAAGAVKRAATP